VDPSELLIPLPKSPRAINPTAPPHLSTVIRWVLRGVGSPPIRLATVKVGGRRYTTAAAIEEFIAATTGRAIVSGTEMTRRRETALRRAEHALDCDRVN
jgi:hypothetical protein